MVLFSQETKALFVLHVTVVLLGFTAILGKLISYGSIILVWHRCVLTAIIYIFIMPTMWQEYKQLTWKTIGIFMFIGVLVSLHWLTFYGSIKFGDSASLTLACFGAVSFFSAILEPLMTNSKFSYVDVALGLVVIIGIVFIYFSLPHDSEKSTSFGWAILSGVISALLCSLFSILNKKCIDRCPPLIISTLEMIGGAIFLTIITPTIYRSETIWYPNFDYHDLHISTIRDGPWDLIWVLILSIVCTNLSFFLMTAALQYVSAFTANLTVNLEPIYGIILGALIFHENQQLNVEFYIGTFIILLAIFLNPLASLLFGDSRSKKLGSEAAYEKVNTVSDVENMESIELVTTAV